MTAPRILQSALLALTVSLLAAQSGPQSSGTSAQKQVSAPWFTDIAGRSTFAYWTNNDLSIRKYFLQPICGGVAILDYDNDGKMDIFFTNGAKLPEVKKADRSFYSCLLRNKGDGTFEDVTEKAGLSGANLGYSMGVAAGDYDNDGHEDLFICNAGRDALYHNNGDGTFTDVTEGSGLDHKPANVLSIGAAWFDYDNDGLLDLIVSTYTEWTPATDRRCQMGDKEIYCAPMNYRSVAQRLYHNLGHGKFEDVTDRSGIGHALGKGMGISIADYNGDGWMDIFIANDTERNFLFINQGDGTFKEQGLLYGVAYNELGATVSGMGSDAKDFDNDGMVDIVYNDLGGQVWGMFRNAGGHSFDDVTRPTHLQALSLPYAGWSMGFIDYDNDGWKDLYSANGDVDNFAPNSKQHDTMFRNIDGKSFVDVSEQMGPAFAIEGYQRGSAFGDLNNDGFLDIVVTSLGEKPRILMNHALNGNHWLLFDLRGHRSNRDGIGARIKVVTGSGRSLYNHATTSVGFMSSSDRRVHFGLGTEKSIKSVEIRWPSGIVQTLGPMAVDQIAKIEEPVGKETDSATKSPAPQ